MRLPLRRLLRGPCGPFVTHASLLTLTAALFALLLRAPPLLALVPCVLLTNRIGALLHEYIHCIPFRRARNNHAVLTLFEGVMLTFGVLELFRSTHLAHHRWVNTQKDPAYGAAVRSRKDQSLVGLLAALELPQHIRYLYDELRHGTGYVRLDRFVAGVVMSLAGCAFWIGVGHASVIPSLLGLTIFSAMVTSSLRGAVEHHGPPGDRGFANEYRSLIPVFNVNRHLHHHMDPRCPWYLLEFCTPSPLGASALFTSWIRVYITREFVLMRPMDRHAGAGSSGNLEATVMNAQAVAPARSSPVTSQL
jgi:fatty acid desaturase